MAGERTVKIKFTGESKGVARAAASAHRSIKKLNDNVTSGMANFGEKIASGITGAIDAIPPMGKPIALVLVAGLSVALAPLIGAAITSAVLFAVGGGVLALGIKSAIDSPRVAKAFEPLKEKASKIFEDFGKPFEKPLIRAAKTFGKVLDSLRPQIMVLGRTIAPVIDKLAPALGEFLKAVMPGITDAVRASVPLFNTLAEKLPLIGRAIGDFFSKISENGDDANVFFGDMLTAIIGLITALGWLISKLAGFYTAVRNYIANAKTHFLELRLFAIDQIGKLLDGAVKGLGWIPGLGPKLKTAQAQFATFRAQANKELQAIKDRQVKINVWSNVGEVAARVGTILAGIGGKVSGKRASGGPVSAGRSYLVGERGPEIVTMGGNGNVTPNRGLGPEILQLTLDIGEGIRQVVNINLREHDRGLKRRTVAAGGRA